jgi:hypothetical protein
VIALPEILPIQYSLPYLLCVTCHYHQAEFAAWGIKTHPAHSPGPISVPSHYLKLSHVCMNHRASVANSWGGASGVRWRLEVTSRQALRLVAEIFPDGETLNRATIFLSQPTSNLHYSIAKQKRPSVVHANDRRLRILEGVPRAISYLLVV